jgi:hypothetical protein
MEEILLLGFVGTSGLVVTLGFSTLTADMTLTRADVDAIADAVCRTCMSDPRFLTVAKYLALK